MTWYFDSHIHLSDPVYFSDMKFILKEMEYLKIKACCVSMNYENSLQTLELAKKNDLVLPFIGIHPECADDELESMMNLIEENHYNISGIGEIGLDPTYANNNNDVKRQNHVFESLLSSADSSLTLSAPAFFRILYIADNPNSDDFMNIVLIFSEKR